MPLVTRNWSESRFTRGVSAFESFTVSGVSTRDAARSAIPYQVGATHPEDASLVVATQPEVQTVGPSGTYKVLANFTADGNYVSEPDPLRRPMRWHPEAMVGQEVVERNISKDPITNSAGYPITGITDDPEDLILVGRRYEPQFSVRTWQTYRGAINADQITLPRIGVIMPGEARLIRYTATDEWDVNSKWVPVEYGLWVRPGDRVEIYTGSGSFAISDGHLKKFLDQGTRGWFKDDKGKEQPGDFYNADGNPVSEPVRLDGTGKPMEAQYKVGPGRKDPIPHKVSYIQRTPGVLDKSNPDAVYIRHCLRPILPFAPLNLGN